MDVSLLDRRWTFYYLTVNGRFSLFDSGLTFLYLIVGGLCFTCQWMEVSLLDHGNTFFFTQWWVDVSLPAVGECFST